MSERLYKQENAIGTLTVLTTKEKFFVLEPTRVVNDDVVLHDADGKLIHGWVVTPASGTGVKFGKEYRHVHPAPSVIFLPDGSYYGLFGEPIKIWTWTNDYAEPVDPDSDLD